jgi:Flp pilus assembly protein TadG
VRLIRGFGAWRSTLDRESKRRHPGQIMLLFAVAFVAICGAIGMSADMGMWIVEQQHLQTAVDSAAIAGARYYVAFTGAADQLTQAQTQAQLFLDRYGYTNAALSSPNGSKNMTSPGLRQFRIQATRTRPTMLLKLIGIPTLTASANSTANGEIKADIYVAIDMTGSMSTADITNMKSAVNTFVDLLGLDPTDANGPKLGIGRFLGERCAHIAYPPNNNYTISSARMNATVASNYISYQNYTPTTGGWCDNNDNMPTLAAATNPTSPPRSTTSTPTIWNNYFPGAVTPAAGQLGQSAANAHSAVNGIDGGVGTSCSVGGGQPSWSAPPSLNPYANCDWLSGTSHTAGLATANVELTSGRARAAPFRKVLILQTDGTVCTMQTAYSQLTPAQSTIRTYLPGANLPAHGDSSATRSENKAMALASAMKTTPTAFEGTEIFTIMFWKNDGNNSCLDDSVFDTDTSLFPECGPDTTTLPAVGARSHVDDYMITMSSSLPGTCDHYIPADKNNPSSLTDAYRKILVRLAVGKLLQ